MGTGINKDGQIGEWVLDVVVDLSLLGLFFKNLVYSVDSNAFLQTNLITAFLPATKPTGLLEAISSSSFKQ